MFMNIILQKEYGKKMKNNYFIIIFTYILVLLDINLLKIHLNESYFPKFKNTVI